MNTRALLLTLKFDLPKEKNARSPFLLGLWERVKDFGLESYLSVKGLNYRAKNPDFIFRES
jgi:hypothetical protein